MRVYIDNDDVLNQLSDDELLEEVETRGLNVPDQDAQEQEAENRDLIRSIYEKRRVGQDYNYELNTLIYQVLGKLI